MATSEDFGILWHRFHEEAQPRGISIVDYCKRNGVVYTHFEKWYRRYVSKVSIVDVKVNDGIAVNVSSKEQTCSAPVNEISGLKIELVNGLTLSQGGMSIESLKRLVSKLEVLCLQ